MFMPSFLCLYSLELQNEKDAAGMCCNTETFCRLTFTKLYSPAADYCVKVDMLLSGMAAGQRRRFATLLNTLVGTGMCRAPSCKPQILPNVAMKYTLPDATCSEFMMDGPKVLPVLLVFPSALPCSCRASDQLVELALQR